jgi:RsiW-degrading membrane proteinase PrsW (M82 family)
MKKAEATIQLHKPSTNEFLFFLLSGAVVSVPLTLFLEQNFVAPFLTGLSAFDVTLLTVAIMAPIVEEFSKVFPLFYRHGETQRSIFTLAILAGLGFGIVEFITYVVGYGPQIIPYRIPGLFFHPATASITAYGIATRRPVPYYLAAVGLHFSNNFLDILAPSIVPAIAIAWTVALLALLTSWRLHGRAKEKFIESENVVCSC